MKRRLVLILTAVILLGVAIAIAVGSGSDPMISRSYWENTYLPALTQSLRERADAATQSTYDAAAAKLEQVGEANVVAAQGKSNGYTLVRLNIGDTLELPNGGSALIQSGSAALGSGTLADVTAGTEALTGEDLTAAHRYIVTSQTATLRQTKAGTVAYLGAGTVRQQSGDPSSVGMPIGEKAFPFTDVTRDQWFYDAVAFVYEKGYFSGTGATTFEPNTSMNRAMVATVLHRLAGGASAASASAFTDVPADAWYAPGIAWASEKNIVNGMGGGLYQPNTPVTREQLVTMLYRYEKDYRKVAVPATGDLTRFPDGANVASWARDAMSWAVGAGLIQGRSTGELDPTGTATRAEVATILQRFAART